MAENKGTCCAGAEEVTSCCRVEALISVDERGQMVIPKEVRAKAGIDAGEKLAMVSCINDGEICCITLMKVDRLNEMARNFLGPVMKEIL